MTDHDGFGVERHSDSGVVTITLDVPEKLNRVSMPARDELARVFAELGEDESVRVIVLGGAGERAFTAGGDVAGFMERSPEVLSRLAHNVGAPERCPKPVLAKLHGFTFGVGLELALACDLRIAAEDTVLGLPEITLGMIPGSGGTQRLAHLIGLSRAKDVILRGRRIEAGDALDWGLVSEVVPLAELDARVRAVAEELAAKAPLALRVAKRVLNHAYDAPLHVGMELEGMAYGLLRGTDDFAEGVAAFVDKRPPKFTGS
jgi:2-oxoglutaroyl-CoA hydrolase